MSHFVYPSTTGYTIYSKSGCHYCTKSKDLLKPVNPLIVDCDEYLIENKDAFLKTIQHLANTECKSFPMIFHDGVFLGGFTEVKVHFETSQFKPQSQFLSFSTEF